MRLPTSQPLLIHAGLVSLVETRFAAAFEGQPGRRRRCYQATMRRKLGLLAVDGGADDQALAEDLLQARRSLWWPPGLVPLHGARGVDREPQRVAALTAAGPCDVSGSACAGRRVPG
jgi:hypothetical protein